MTFFAAVGIKAIERNLSSARARTFFIIAAFTLALLSLFTWIVCAALAFAPEHHSQFLSLAPASDPINRNVILLVATLVGDVCWSTISLSRAESVLLGKRQTCTIVNPRYSRLAATRVALTKSIAPNPGNASV